VENCFLRRICSRWPVVAATSVDDLLIVARTARANGQDTLAEKFLDKALLLDPSRLAEIQSLDSAAKSAKPQNATAPALPVQPRRSIRALGWPVANRWAGGGGTIYTPTISPHDPKVALVTCDMSAVYMTRDGGRHWHVLPHMRYGHGIAFGWDANTVFVGCSDRLYRSNDAGNTWQGIGGERKHPTCACYDVVIDPEDGRTVWAAYGVAGEAGHPVSDRNRFLVERSVDAASRSRIARRDCRKAAEWSRSWLSIARVPKATGHCTPRHRRDFPQQRRRSELGSGRQGLAQIRSARLRCAL